MNTINLALEQRDLVLQWPDGASSRFRTTSTPTQRTVFIIHTSYAITAA